MMSMEAIGIKSHNTYINTLNDLEEIGLITMIERSKNQYSANIVALSNFDKAHSKALDKALRRRFVFTEMKPDYSLLEDVIVDEINISEMLRKMNEKISEIKCSRDYEIGHAYFWPLKEDPSLDKLKSIFI